MASLSSVERYDPHLDKWIEVKEMGQRRAGNGVSELHGCLYVVGEWMVFLWSNFLQGIQLQCYKTTQ